MCETHTAAHMPAMNWLSKRWGLRLCSDQAAGSFLSLSFPSPNHHHWLQVFKVSRDGEEDNFKPAARLGNRKLLWHGSRVTNFAGIFSQGLRIAPPEAPSVSFSWSPVVHQPFQCFCFEKETNGKTFLDPQTGYMFGKGVYFADMVSKSANYCKTTKDDNIGLLLLCDVALGEMQVFCSWGSAIDFIMSRVLSDRVPTLHKKGSCEITK